MAKESVIKALDRPGNAAIESTVGPLLRQLLDKEGWREIILLQHLDQASLRLEGWNGLFSRARKALADPNDLPRRANLLPSFAQKRNCRCCLQRIRERTRDSRREPDSQIARRIGVFRPNADYYRPINDKF